MGFSDALKKMSKCRIGIGCKGLDFSNESENEAKTAPQRVNFGRSCVALWRSWVQKAAKGSKGKGDEGKTCERIGKKSRRVVAVVLAGGRLKL